MIEWISTLTAPILIGLYLTAVILSLTMDWRLRFGGLAAQYALTAALMAPLVIWQVAAVKAVVGVLIVVILFISGRAVGFGRPPAAGAPPAGRLAAWRRIEFQTNLPFRITAALLGTVAAWFFVTELGMVVPGLSPALNLAGMELIVLGLISLGLTEEPLNAGIALLMLFNGFELLYTPVERSLTVAGLLAAVNFGVALAVSHLTWLRHHTWDGAE
ncbi:MAG: hypothetical protein KA764_03300 [Anaerolineales bacterium]|nr:hypothetical protein [Anaerolineales bacterium]